MAESFLEEQLRRIRKMTEQVSRLRPPHDVSDRPIASSQEECAAPEEQAPPLCERPVRDPSRRRGR